MGIGEVLCKFERAEMTPRRLKAILWSKIEVTCGVATALSAMIVAIDLFIPSYRAHDLSFQSLLFLFLPLIASVIFGVAACLHARARMTWALMVMFIVGSINNAFIIILGGGLVYIFALLQDSLGLNALITNFLSVLMTLAAALIGWDPFRDDPQPDFLK